MALRDLFGPTPPEPQPIHEAEQFATPYGVQRYHEHQARHRLTRSLYVGATVDGMVYTGPDEHLLVGAGPRSSFGKTTHAAATNLIKHPGPVAFFTSKPHGIITATAQVRAAIAGDPADVMHMSFDGEPFPGLTKACWSFIAHAEGDYDLIEDGIRQMASVSVGEGDAKQAFWTESAIVYVATVWTAASLMYRDGEEPWA